MTVIKWAIGGAVFGAASAISADYCLLAIPAWPGAALASVAMTISGNVGNEGILTDQGARLDWLVPANVIVYGIAGAVFPCLPPIVKRRRRKAGLCVSCAYDLTGNESGICPECGTEVKA